MFKIKNYKNILTYNLSNYYANGVKLLNIEERNMTTLLRCITL